MKNVEGIIIILALLYITIFFETKYHFQGNDGIKREKMCHFHNPFRPKKKGINYFKRETKKSKPYEMIEGIKVFRTKTRYARLGSARQRLGLIR